MLGWGVDADWRSVLVGIIINSINSDKGYHITSVYILDVCMFLQHDMPIEACHYYFNDVVKAEGS